MGSEKKKKNEAIIVIQGLLVCYEGQSWMTLEISKALGRDGIIDLKKQQQVLIMKAKEILEKFTELEDHSELARECEAEFGVYIRILKNVLTGHRPFQRAVIEELSTSQQRQVKLYNELLGKVILETDKEKLEPLSSRLRIQLNRVRLDTATYVLQPTGAPSPSNLSPSPPSPSTSNSSSPSTPNPPSSSASYSSFPTSFSQNPLTLPKKSNSTRVSTNPTSTNSHQILLTETNQNVSNPNQMINNKASTSGSSSQGVTCQLCRKMGHTAKACTSNNREIQCQLCDSFGHEATACSSFTQSSAHAISVCSTHNPSSLSEHPDEKNVNTSSNSVESKKKENRVKEQGVEVLKMVKEFIRIAEGEGKEEEVSNKVIELMKNVNQLMDLGLEVVSTDWINLLVDDEWAVREGVFRLVAAAMEKKFKRLNESVEMKEELEKIVLQLSTALKNFIVSSEIFVKS